MTGCTGTGGVGDGPSAAEPSGQSLHPVAQEWATSLTRSSGRGRNLHKAHLCLVILPFPLDRLPNTQIVPVLVQVHSSHLAFACSNNCHPTNSNGGLAPGPVGPRCTTDCGIASDSAADHHVCAQSWKMCSHAFQDFSVGLAAAVRMQFINQCVQHTTAGSY
jgi:hypothetical protein